MRPRKTSCPPSKPPLALVLTSSDWFSLQHQTVADTGHRDCGVFITAANIRAEYHDHTLQTNWIGCTYLNATAPRSCPLPAHATLYGCAMVVCGAAKGSMSVKEGR
ncbi:hypothetical protein L226DRAFT_295539 [Lentinus tigrinus ALCF2SS1-7]|uniref:uncharacterized protein n=1 Tax=Lentinus tigrinus ALCF2SS1-7 TaxID=1328758 RepID=UPI001165D5EC|nr:hypothetical protein L226DRAFT_295539 [Lentinus tigrinus ALCF2SS1-7]